MRRKGFTLVELAIVLVIIGLILGAILKGQAMVRNAKMKRLKADIDSIVAAVYSYQDRYGALPGDDPADRTGTPFNAAQCAGGNGDGILGTADERICFWQELIGAGLMSGDPTLHDEVKVAKRNPFGGRYLVRYGNDINGSGRSGNYIYVENIPTEIRKALDEKYDDGVYNKGDIQSNQDYNTNTGSGDMYWIVF